MKGLLLLLDATALFDRSAEEEADEAEEDDDDDEVVVVVATGPRFNRVVCCSIWACCLAKRVCSATYST